MSRSLKKMSSDLDTKYSKFNKDSPGVVSDLLLQLEVRPAGLVAPTRPQGKSKVKNSPINVRGKGKRWVNNPTGLAQPSSVLGRGKPRRSTLSQCPEMALSPPVTLSQAPGHHQSEGVQGEAMCCP